MYVSTLFCTKLFIAWPKNYLPQVFEGHEMDNNNFAWFGELQNTLFHSRVWSKVGINCLHFEDTSSTNCQFLQQLRIGLPCFSSSALGFSCSLLAWFGLWPKERKQTQFAVRSYKLWHSALDFPSFFKTSILHTLNDVRLMKCLTLPTLLLKSHLRWYVPLVC